MASRSMRWSVSASGYKIEVDEFNNDNNDDVWYPAYIKWRQRASPELAALALGTHT